MTRYYQNNFIGAIEDFSSYLKVDSKDKEVILNLDACYKKLGK